MEALPQKTPVLNQEATGFVGLKEPLVGIHRNRVGFRQGLQVRAGIGQAGRRRAIGAIHVHPEILLPRQRQVERVETDPKGGKVKVRLNIAEPARIKLILKSVDQDLFDNLERILGPTYFSSFRSEGFIDVEPKEFESKKTGYAKVLVPAVLGMRIG